MPEEDKGNTDSAATPLVQNENPKALPMTPSEVKTPLSTGTNETPKTGEGSVLVDEYRRPDGRYITLLEHRAGSGALLKFEVACTDKEGRIDWQKDFYYKNKALEEYEKWRT